MIGSHDTFTYLQPANPACRLFTRLWRTQRLTIHEQYLRGVRFFDIRVVHHRRKWHFAHGMVRLKGHTFDNIDDICNWMLQCFPLAAYRIVLERGDRKTEVLFSSQTRAVLSSPTLRERALLWQADIRAHRRWNGEIVNRSEFLAGRGYTFAKAPNTWTTPCVEAHGTVTIRNWRSADLRKEAQATNARLDVKAQLAKPSKERLLLIDYIDIT